MTGGELAALSVVLPLLGGALILLTGRRPNVREGVTLATSLGLFAVVLQVVQAGPVSFTFVEILPGISLSLSVEPLGRLFALVASGLWIITSLYSIGYMRAHHEHHQTRYYFFFTAAIASAMGVAFAGNLVTLFVFYEALTLSTYPLVTHHGDAESVRAGRVYLGLLITTSVGFLFLAIVWTWYLAGTVDFRPGGILQGKAGPAGVALLLGLYAFGTGKAALMPFHRWLPAAMVAPTPVSALLHAVAVVKAGVFTVTKIVVYVFGVDLLRDTGASVWLQYAAAATILIASIVALTKDNIKARLAYSTVAQLSYIVLGVALAQSWGVIGGAMHIATHAFGKITLFFCAGAIFTAAHKTKLSELDGLGRRMPFTFAAFLVGALSVVGLPPFGGSWSKFCLAMGAAEAGQAALVGVLMVGSLLSLANFLPIVMRGFFGPGEPAKIQEAPLFCVAPPCLAAAGCVALFFFADDIYRLLTPLAP